MNDELTPDNDDLEVEEAVPTEADLDASFDLSDGDAAEGGRPIGEIRVGRLE